MCITREGERISNEIEIFRFTLNQDRRFDQPPRILRTSPNSQICESDDVNLHSHLARSNDRENSP